MSRIPLQIASRSILISFAVCTLFVTELSSQSIGTGGISITTIDRLRTPGFWPTKGDAKREDFIGTAECQECHAEIATTQANTAMAQASFRAMDSPILRQHPALRFRSGSYEYEIISSSTEIQYVVNKDISQRRS